MVLRNCVSNYKAAETIVVKWRWRTDSDVSRTSYQRSLLIGWLINLPPALPMFNPRPFRNHVTLLTNELLDSTVADYNLKNIKVGLE